MHNAEIADALNRLANLLEISGANPFRVRAYRNASRIVGTLGREVGDLLSSGEDLTKIRGIGQDLARKIEELYRTGNLGALREAERAVPAGLLQLLRVPSLGPKRIAALHDKLGVANLDDLEHAASAHQIRSLAGFGALTESRFLDEIQRLKAAGPGRWKRYRVEGEANRILNLLAQSPGVSQANIAGSYRRASEIVGDLDFLVACQSSEPVMERLVKYPSVARVISRGDTRTTLILKNGLQVDVRVVPEKSFGAALHYFTGSKQHNIAVRGMGLKKGLKINEYGVFRGKRQIAGKTEEDVYATVGLPYIEPELREMRGEVEAAIAGSLPRLVALEEIQGDLHSHTSETDGRATLEEMIQAAIGRGYRYLAITDHSQSLAMTGGLDIRRLSAQGRLIDRMNDRYGRQLRVLRSSEVDILLDGGLDFPDSALRKLDLTVCSVHSRFKISRERQTERIIRAMQNPYCSILGHPSGRLINEREAYEVDMEQILRAAADLGVLMEINAQPDRLDLDDIHCKMAKGLGVHTVISTDAHGPDEFAFLKYGVGQARRGWLSPNDVANTWPVTRLLKFIEVRREQRGAPPSRAA